MPMNFLDKLERKYGRYAIPNLPAIMIALYAAGYLIMYMMPQLLSYLTLHPGLIMRGQVWRIISWILVPPGRFDLFTIVMLYFYFSVGKTMERTWGDFRFNVYVLSGILFTVIGAFLLYYFGGAYYNSLAFSTYYINMSICLAFAFTYPNIEVLLYFLIPIKMKWIGILYAATLVYSMFSGGLSTRIAIFSALLNFLIYFLSSRDMRRFRPNEIHRRQEFKRNVQKVQPRGGTRHKCAVCGRTENDGAHLEFRYCSKCDGNYEYCQDHLFTHQHIKKK